ncbi:MAG TPA: GNAT family N-acetyltransferase [Anaerolineales bacterium]|nr:GNAT family N-acetyltransferase [Anaerolineales bacterium]
MGDKQPFQIDIPDYWIDRLQPEHVEALQMLCERCADYTRIVEGEGVSPTSAQEIMQDAPPGRSLDDKFLYGVLDHQDDLVGVLEGMRHYPEENIWWIGLLMLAPEARGCGIGRKVVQSFFEHVRSEQGTAVMLGVVEENKSAYRFWQQMGFELVRQTEPRPFGKKTQLVYVMRKEV